MTCRDVKAVTVLVAVVGRPEREPHAGGGAAGG